MHHAMVFNSVMNICAVLRFLKKPGLHTLRDREHVSWVFHAPLELVLRDIAIVGYE